MSFEAQNNELKNICKELLESKKVDTILAYREGGIEGMQIPFFLSDPKDVDKIVWGDRCYQHLANYLYGRKDKVAIIAKPCDVRVIVQYILEQQIKRDNVYIIGMDCTGVKDAEGNMRPGCNDCKVHTPPIFDVHVKNPMVDALDSAALDSMDTEKDTETLVKNLSKFQEEIDKCILCFSCRQACYGCYCKTCFIERDIPGWSPSEVDRGTKMTFHLGRAMHLSGRCVECGSCESACASGVNVRYIIKEVTEFIDKTYDYKSGLDLETTPALLTHKFEDKEIGFLGGEQHA